MPIRLALALSVVLAAAPAAQTDSSFGDGGYVVLGLGDGPSAVAAVAIGPDGAITALGSDESSAEGSRFAVTRLRPDGSPDPAFGDGGTAFVVVPPAQSSGGPHLAASQHVFPDGAVVLTGDVNKKVFTARLTAAGVPDPAYGDDGLSGVLFEGTVAALLPLADGAVLLAGTQHRTARLVLARVGADGRLDPSFGADGLVTTAEPISATGMARAPDGRVVVAGYAGRWGEALDAVVVRFGADGARDETFGTDGLARVDVGRMDLADPVAVRPDGRILVAGRDYGATTFVAQITATGALDPAFGDGGVFVHSHSEGGPSRGPSDTDDTVRALHLQPDGRLLLTGALRIPVSESATTSGLYVARLTAGGAFDPTFGADGVVEARFATGRFSDGRALAIDAATGAVLAAGSALSAEAGSGFGFVRFRPDARTTAGDERPGPASALRVAPNPSSGSSVAHYGGRPVAEAAVVVLDVLGREVAAVHAGPLAAGARLRLPRLAPGAYILRVRAGAEAWVQPFTVAR